MITKLTLEYDGSGFAGWARQPELRTVQGELETALRAVLGERDVDGEPLGLTVAGRTDRGVHAWAQVASYAHEAVDPVRLNTLLPPDIAVLAAEPAPAGFDARRDARSRTYCYRVLPRPTRGVFARGNALWWPHPIDREALAECARALPGRHDFTAFTPTETEHTRFEREVLRADWRPIAVATAAATTTTAAAPDRPGEPASSPTRSPPVREGGLEEGGLLEFWIEADTFMRHMNRVLVGTMLEVAVGRRPIDDFEHLLEGRPRSEAGPTAPAHGLALASVAYV
jgi:tRNA pseudouridine38-40 synthase